MRTKARKLIWSVPLVAALAVVGALALFATLTPNDASAQANVGIPPGKPMNLMALAYSEGIPQEEIQLDWDAPTDGGSPRGYRIDISKNGGYTWVALESDFRNTSYTHEDLLASETYHYRVFALNQHGVSVVSDIVSGSTDASVEPDRPTNLVAVVGPSPTTPGVADSTTELEIKLTWLAPVNPDGAPVKSYVVEYSVDGTVWDPVPEVKKPGDKHKMLTDDIVTLEAGVEYQYRVAAVNSVGQSGWSSTATEETLPGAIPDQPETSDFTPGVAPVELNVWLFWEPPDDPLGDRITGYEIEGRPIKVGGPRLFGGQPAALADLGAVLDGPDEDTDEDIDGDGTDTDDDDDLNLGNLQVAGIHVTGITLGRDNNEALTLTDHTGADADDDTVFDFDDIASRLQADIQAARTSVPDTDWVGAMAYSHPMTVRLEEDHDNDSVSGGDDATPEIDVFYSTRKDVPDTVDPVTVVNEADVLDTTPDSRYWTRHEISHLNFEAATVRYTGLRFELIIPRVIPSTMEAPALPFPSSASGPDVAELLGWTEGKDAVSYPEYKCCVNVEDDPSTDDVDESTIGWQVVKTDIDRPSGTEINQFLVTRSDIGNTDYSSQFTANTGWQFRIRALNRRAPAETTQEDVMVPNDTSLLLGSWTADIDATPGSDTALRRPDTLSVRRSVDDNEGRTGLILKWNKAATVPDSDGDSVDATGYRIEYSDTGLEAEGYDWQVLQDLYVPMDTADLADAQQIFRDNHEGELGANDTLAAGQTRHYRVYGLTAAEGEMSWPSPQEMGHTANPLKPNPPQRVRVVERGHTHISLEWEAPDARKDDLDGSEEGPSVITHYVIEVSNDEGVTWSELEDDDGDTLEVEATKYTDDTLMPGQTRDYRILAVNSSQISVWSNTVDGTTLEAVLPNEPGGLAAQTGDTGGSVKLCWNAQAEQPEDAPVFEYLIQYSADGETNWMDLATVIEMTDDEVHTVYTDTTLDASETRFYRVFAINLRGQSDQSDVADATAEAATVPDAPMANATATSDTEITVMWGSPASDGGADITGYVLQRAYKDADDTMTDFMTIAATDAATWWNTLDCPMMNAAIPDDATPAPPADDADTTSPYCAMYDGLAADAKEEVDAVFAANYGTITDTSYMDMGLMPETMYYYRVAAMNSVGLSEYSDGMAYAMTDRTNVAPMAGDDIADQTVTAGMTVMVQSTITDADPEDSMLSWDESSSDDMIATASADNMGMVTITGVAAGDATITVTATDGMGESDMQTFMVTVEAADTDMSLQDIPDSSISVTNNANGAITVSWMGGDNADSFIVVAAELDSDPFTYESVNVAGDAAKMTTITGLNSGSSYIIIVIALQGTSFEYGVPPNVTAN